MAGNVFVEGQREDKAGTTFPDTVQIEVRGHVLPYVSRGGLKLEKAIANFDVSVDGKSVQMWVRPPADLRIVCFKTVPERYLRLMWEEDSWTGNSDRMSGLCVWRRTNIRYVVPEDLGEPIDFSSIDVSFISLTKVLEPIRNYLKEDGEIVALIKPQFEAGREKVGKKGVVREKSTHHEVIEKVALYAQSIGFKILNIDFSPIKGPEGNIEYLIHLKKWPNPVEDALLEDLSLVVDRAFETLAK